jgi:1,4-alpha-glucan branching enzyme
MNNRPVSNCTADKNINAKVEAMLKGDPYLAPFEDHIARRLGKTEHTLVRLTRGKRSLADFASGHEYFGLHWETKGSQNRWLLREWAPNASAVYLVGDMSGWEENERFALKRLNRHGVWEIHLPPEILSHGDHYRLRIHWPGGAGDRIPAWARRVVQDPKTLIFNAQVWRPQIAHQWKIPHFQPRKSAPLIYEAHVGMAQEKEGVGTYRDFQEHILPRIVAAGYNTLQLMAIQEHPYYASFGYHVSSFFAASSRFGTPEELKRLIDAAHGQGLAVVIDLIHSHAIANQVEGLSLFDGTPYQYFHQGPRGYHAAWDSYCFDYGKPEVLHFLLSNCRYWLDEFRVDGFRFDGITSMLYHYHGLGKAFTSYADYFDDSVDEEALVYLALANRLIHAVNPRALTIAEDVSGMPGLALDQEKGGIGFDYRFAMGVPDYWIKLTKDTKDEDWPMGGLWHELTNRRGDEKTISYAESHDQALVGDKTLIFRLLDDRMYSQMHIIESGDDLIVDRGLALHKMIRLITLATAGNGYLNFMGNEFGHPEWIDFPRQGNHWSYKYARRQWRLADDPNLKYHHLKIFDQDMLALACESRILDQPLIELLWEHDLQKVLVFRRADLVLAFNFHPTESYSDYAIQAPAGNYRLILDSDSPRYGGHGRLAGDQTFFTQSTDEGPRLQLYLPTRTAIVLQKKG